MSHLTESEGNGHRELIFPCDCNDDHFLRITWDDSDRTYRYLWITGSIRPQGVWPRLSAAARIIFGKEYCSTEIVLSPETVTSLHAFLSLLPLP